MTLVSVTGQGLSRDMIFTDNESYISSTAVGVPCEAYLPSNDFHLGQWLPCTPGFVFDLTVSSASVCALNGRSPLLQYKMFC